MIRRIVVPNVFVLLSHCLLVQGTVLGQDERKQMLLPPTGKVDMVLDTDTYNEIDDQFALVYALLSKERINLKAVYAAPFLNKRSSGPRDGMEKSYQEILNIYQFMGISPLGNVFKGSDSFLEDREKPINSDASEHLIKLSANYSKENPLYVVAVGAITNIASALLTEPKLATRIVLIWVGGNSFTWPKATEFNSEQDLVSANVVFDSGVPLVQIPAKPVTTHLTTTIAELKQNLSEKGQVANYLLSIYKGYLTDYDRPGTSKIIWDIAGVAWLVNPDWVPTMIGPSPNISTDHTYQFNEERHEIRYAYYVSRDQIFKDFFEKIGRGK